MGKTYFVSQKEMPRAGLIRAALAGKITNSEGSGSLGLSVRQFQRLKIRYRESGTRGLLHQSRGRPSGSGLSASHRQKIQVLMQSTYSDFNDCHLTEKLREVEKIPVSRETVRRIRLGLKKEAKRKRRAPKHRSRRLREAHVGALLQIDGSPHDWLQGRGPEMSLIGAVDDATGDVLKGVFRLQEDLHGYATLFHQLFQDYGLPLAFYGDGTGVLVRNDDHWPDGRILLTWDGPCAIWASPISGQGLLRPRVEWRTAGAPSRTDSSPRWRSAASAPWSNPMPTCRSSWKTSAAALPSPHAKPPLPGESHHPAGSSPSAAVTSDAWARTTPFAWVPPASVIAIIARPTIVSP